MKNFLLALQFLTIIPVKVRGVEEKDIGRSVVYFPLVGLFLGLILTGANNLFLFLGFGEVFINITLVVLLIVLTGGIHMDGLADTADAFLSRKNKDEMLRIMRDSRIGAMGVLALISVVLLKIVFLSCVNVPLKPASLIIMCVLSRWCLVFSLFLFPYARQEGKAKLYTESANFRALIFSTITVLCCAFLFLKIHGLLVLLIIAILTYAMGRFIVGKVGGITGDTLGAANEIIEVSVLFILCLLGRLIYV